MSRVYFHSPHGDAELRGSERAWLGSLVDSIAFGFLDRYTDAEQLLALVRPGHWLHKEDRTQPGWALTWYDRARLALGTGNDDDPVLQWRGHGIDTFSLRLNTALRYGSDPVRLAARIHGQCEIHAYVEGINRAWLANLIQQGLDEHVYRAGIWYTDRPGVNPAAQPDRRWSDQGWGEVVKLLRDRDDEPVVMSYSVCDGFPNREAARWEPPPMPEGWAPDWADDDEGRAEWAERYPHLEGREDYYRSTAGDAWYDLPDEERWRIAMGGLRGSDGGLEISPDEFGKYYFTHGLTLPDLLAPDYEERLDKALGFAEEAAEPVPDPIAAAVASMRVIEQADRGAES